MRDTPPFRQNWVSFKSCWIFSPEYSRCENVLKSPRGGHFNFLLTPMGGKVGGKSAAPGGFLVQKGRFLLVQKFIYFEFVSNIRILAPYI